MALFGKKKKKKEKEAETRSEEKAVDGEEKKDLKTESENSVRVKEKEEKKKEKRNTGRRGKTDQRKSSTPSSSFKAHEVLFSPRITEKATYLSGDSVYTFNVNSKANKKEIAKSVEAVYGVKPKKVRTVNVRGKEVLSRGRKGRRTGGKKAYVYLKKEDSIELI